MFNVYTMHGRDSATIILPPMRDLREVAEYARASARLGHDVLIRAYEVTGDSVTGQLFARGYSVLAGEVRELYDPVIPRAHW